MELNAVSGLSNVQWNSQKALNHCVQYRVYTLQAVHCWSMSWTSGWEQKGFSADWPTLPLQLSSPSYCSLYDDQMLMTEMYQSGGGGLVWPSCKLLPITHDSSLPLVSIKTLLHYVELPPSLRCHIRLSAFIFAICLPLSSISCSPTISWTILNVCT